MMLERGVFVGIVALLAATGRRCDAGAAAPSADDRPAPDGRLLTSGDVVRAAGPLTVAFGRATAIPRRRGIDLYVRAGDRCTATVAAAEPQARRIGRLQPTTFPCQFSEGELTYTHFGLKSPLWDRIHLLIKYDSRWQTLLIPLTVTVNVDASLPYDVVRLGRPVEVGRPLGHSSPIDSRAVQFKYDRTKEDCRLSVLNAANEWPIYGVIANDTAATTDVNCDDFLRSNVRYLSTVAAATGRDHVLASVTVQDLSGDSGVQLEHFQLEVNLLFAAPNEPPSFSLSALMSLDVNQFIMTAITPEVLQADDKETPTHLVVFNLTRSLDPEEGQIVCTDDPELPVVSFYQEDVGLLRIAYKPPASDSDVPRHIRIPVQAVDSEGLTSDTFDLTVIVNPMNTLAPLVTRNLGLALVEGESRQLSSAHNLQVADEDNLSDVRIRALRGPEHGRLYVSTAPTRGYFTAADLDNGAVAYEHDGSDSFSDNIIFCMSDGRHEVQFLLPINIYPVDDSCPILTANTGMQIFEGTTQQITLHQLSAYDVDGEPNSAIVYELQQPYSTVSEMVLRVQTQPADFRGWSRVRNYWERRVVEWTQLDIQRGHLYYKHIGRHSRNVTLDVVRFHLRDSAKPPNESPTHELLVHVLPQDLTQPERCSQDMMLMTVNESQLTVFTRKQLCYADEDSDDRNLVYTITRPPYTTTTIDEKDCGQIVFTDTPSIIASTFKQSHVNHGKIAYMPPPDEVGIVPKIVEFIYTVVDPAGNEQTNQLHRMLLQPVDNKPPRVLSTGVTVYENGYAIIMPTLLYADDPDTPAELIGFKIVVPPSQGTLRLTGVPMYAGHVFRKKDIEAGSITYTHSGSESTEDWFGIEVSDGTHVVPVHFRVTVTPVDDEPPYLPSGPDSRLRITVNEGGSVLLGANLLAARDNDTDESRLTFIVETPPEHGFITVGGKRSTTFSQPQVHNNSVLYHHDGTEVGHTDGRDLLVLTLTDLSEEWDRGGNALRGIQIEVTVKPIDNKQPELTVNPAPLVVAEGSARIITTGHLMVIDVDSPDDVLVCTLTTQPRFGFVEIVSPGPGSEISRKGIPASAFYWRDVRASSVNYVQSIHQGIEPTEDLFTLACSDGINTSPQQPFRISIRPVCDEVPVIHVREFVVLEGHRLVIDTPLLNAEDADVPQDQLHFKITVVPLHGRIASDSGDDTVDVSRFALSDIVHDSRIFYEHDNTETVRDSFVLEVTDGIHKVSQKINIVIVPVDDETPRLTINNGLDLERPLLGAVDPQWKFITNRDLMAEDLDSNNKNITFRVRQQPVFGFLQRFNLASKDWDNVTRGLTFQQWEIDDRHLRYVHAGRQGVRDLIKFDVSDPAANTLVDRYFYVTVEGIDQSHPDVISKGIELPQSNSVVITTDVLSAADDNSPVEHLHYTVTKTPMKGYLVLTDFPGQPVTTFTQLHLAGSKLRYIHNGTDESLADHFEFEVTDGFNPVHRAFKITLVPVNNKLPALHRTVLRVREGSIKVITPFELDVTDPDTNARSIIYTVTRLPKHGTMLAGDRTSPRTFTVDDVRSGRVMYRHDGSETASDSFSITVSDGAHDAFYIADSSLPTRSAQQVLIEVVPVDDSFPRLVVNKGAVDLQLLPVHIGAGASAVGVCLARHLLRADDPDTTAAHLTYTVQSPPRFGRLIRIKDVLKNISSWTQEDIDSASVCYLLKDGVAETEDSFTFSITDRGGNTIEKEPFIIRWSFVRFSQSEYSCYEADRKISIKLIRRGHLEDTAFVALRTHDSTARAGMDFSRRFETQVQFSPGEIEKMWTLAIIDDTKYEEYEQFFVEIFDPITTLLEGVRKVSVTIHDPEDESVVFFESSDQRVEEGVTIVNLTVRRLADVSDELMVICATKQGTAVGSVPGTLTTGTDYVTRTADFNSVLRFDVNETVKPCLISLIDDSLYEAEESFTASLLSPLGGKLGASNVATVTILADKSDEPFVYFEQSSYIVDESKPSLTVRLLRGGTDLTHVSSVTVRSRRTNPASAEHGSDYVAVSRTVQFNKGETSQYINVYIIDDVSAPQLEGPESFHLHLQAAVNTSIADPRSCLVTIDDSVSDLPSFEFTAAAYTVTEDSNMVAPIVKRTGDSSLSAAVRCYTRQQTARASADYVERPDTDVSSLYFAPGETEKPCNVMLVEDTLYEKREDFRVVLGSARLVNSGRPATIGSQNSATISIEDEADKPTVRFERPTYEVKEPQAPDEVLKAKVVLIRHGDLSQTSVVRAYTRDGSAKAGQDYAGYSTELVFGPNVSRHSIEIGILYDADREQREFFSLLLAEDRMVLPAAESVKAIIYITEQNPTTQITFPAAPIIISLRDYDDVATGVSRLPIPGYPVVCISSCNPRHPNFHATSELCTKERIDDSATRYRWFASTADVGGNRKPALHLVDAETFFTSTKEKTLDSIYFRPGSSLQCRARAVSLDGDIGLERASAEIMVDRAASGPCPPQQAHDLGAEPFTARIRYTGLSDSTRGNAMRISVRVPHRDGMLPALSTHRLSNFEFALSRDSSRVGQHRCSNLVDDVEAGSLAATGFLMAAVKEGRVAHGILPYQYDASLRQPKTVRFYSNLDLSSCHWEFVAFYSMSELVNECGARIETGGQVYNATQSFVTLVIPLYVSYTFYSVKVSGGWQSVDLSSNMPVTFAYDTSMLWQSGITCDSSGGTGELQGTIYPTSMRIQADGRLAATFKSQTAFRGMFVAKHTSLASTVSCQELPDLKLKLTLVRSQPTFDGPEQLWEFVSELAMRDYSGTYVVSLVPCTVTAEQAYSTQAVCSPRQPIVFRLQIRLQQVSDAVPAEYTLNTEFRVMKQKAQWLAVVENASSSAIDSNVAFGMDEKMYGKVALDKAQSLGPGLHVTVEKVFVCSGKDGYVPKYHPDKNEFGCVAPSPSLQYQFKVVDKNDPQTVVGDVQGVPFNAQLAVDDVGTTPVSQHAESDGFSFDCRPLFAVDPSRPWFVHVVYTIKSPENSFRTNRGRRADGQQQQQMGFSALNPPTHSSRSLKDPLTGTNMVRLLLQLQKPFAQPSAPARLAQELAFTPSASSLLPVVCSLVGGVLLLATVATAVTVTVLRQRGHRQATSTALVQAGSTANSNGAALHQTQVQLQHRGGTSAVMAAVV